MDTEIIEQLSNSKYLITSYTSVYWEANNIRVATQEIPRTRKFITEFIRARH